VSHGTASAERRARRDGVYQVIQTTEAIGYSMSGPFIALSLSHGAANSFDEPVYRRIAY
jgi:hypothetical protein